LKEQKKNKIRATAAFCQEYMFNCYCNIGEIDTAVAFYKEMMKPGVFGRFVTSKEVHPADCITKNVEEWIKNLRVV
jgi:pentatricopeptide repeat protein